MDGLFKQEDISQSDTESQSFEYVTIGDRDILDSEEELTDAASFELKTELIDIKDNIIKLEPITTDDIDVKDEPACSKSPPINKNVILRMKNSIKEKIQTKLLENLKCPYCEHVAVDKNSLGQHLEIHINKKRFMCHICKEKFFCSTSLQVHVKSHTTVPKKPFKCECCSSAFQFEKGLWRHMHRHIDVNLFECAVCNLKFVVRSMCDDHVKLHYGEKPFQLCPCKIVH